MVNGNVNPHKFDKNFTYKELNDFDWSPDSKYFIVGGQENARIFDMNGTEYKYPKSADFPTNTEIRMIRWTY